MLWREKMKTGKLLKVLTCLISALLIITSVPLYAAALDEADYDGVSYPYYGEDAYSYLESVKVKNQRAQAIIEYIYASYGDGYYRYKGSGQCYGYAEMTRKLFGTRYKERKYGIKATRKNLYKKLKKLKPGTHVRFSAAANGSRNPSHSIVLLKINKDTIWYTDGNYDDNNGIRIDERSLADLAYSTQNNGYKYLAWTREPRGSIPAVNEPEPKAFDEGLGKGTNIVWRPVKGAKSYVVYRSLKKKSGYKKIATVKKSRYHYTDKTKGVYGRVYYKVVAVKSGGKKAKSAPVRVNRPLTAPRVYMKMHYEDEEPWFELTWEPVKGATRYKIYRYDYDKDKMVKLATVKGKKWIHRIGDDEGYLELYITAATTRKGSESLPEVMDIYTGW